MRTELYNTYTLTASNNFLFKKAHKTKILATSNKEIINCAWHHQHYHYYPRPVSLGKRSYSYFKV